MNPELQAKIANWRLKAAAGTLTLEEEREVIRDLRAGRLAAAESASKSAAKRTTARKAVVSGDDLLEELE